MASICAAVLAGGRSSRMRRDKAGLPIQGATLLERQRQLLSSLPIQQLLISGKNVNGVADHYIERGPLGGLHALLRQCEQDYLLTIAVDMPLLQAADLQLLIEQGVSQQAPCHYQNHYLPLMLPVKQEMILWLESQLQHAENQLCSMRRFCQQFQAVAIPCEHPEHLSNANTPEQWQACLAQMTV